MKLKLQSRVAKTERYGVTISDTQVPHPVAQFAMVLIERWGMVQGESDGEDSAGRAKIKLMNEQDVVARACKTAQIAFEQFALKDWLLDVPNPTREELAKLPN
jgi:hypothetical protein